MAEEISVREKNTEPITVQALSDGNIIDLTGVHHVEWHMLDAKKKVYRYATNDTAPCLTIANASQGKVTFTPPDESVFKYVRNPYRMYITIYDTVTEHYSVPESGDENIIEVRKEF